jgi:hypothetical protein
LAASIPRRPAIQTPRRCCVCKRNPDSADALGEVRLPLEKSQLEAAKAMADDNKSAQWAAGHGLFLLAGDSVGLREALGCFLWELEGIATATISDMTGYSGRELKEMHAADPISLFECLDCSDPIVPKDRPHFMRLNRELRLICASRLGDEVVDELLCDGCAGVRRELLKVERRLRRISWQARLDEIKKMPHADYLQTREWKARKYQALCRAGHRCQTCATRHARLEVHHNCYEKYGDERPYDLVVLCERCHGLFHRGLQDAS